MYNIVILSTESEVYMVIPTRNYTKEDMLFYLESKGTKVLRRFAIAINANPLSTHEVSEGGSCSEILVESIDNPKAVLWKEAVNLCPELIAGYDDAESCEDEDTDEDEDDDDEIDDDEDEDDDEIDDE